MRIINEPIRPGVIVRSIDTTYEVPARLTTPQFKWIWLCSKMDGSGAAIEFTEPSVRPTTYDIERVIGAWPTQHDSTLLQRAVQNDRIIQFQADVNAYGDQGEPDALYDVTTDEEWWVRNANAVAHGPIGLCAALYFRLECFRALSVDAAGLGIAQANLRGLEHPDDGDVSGVDPEPDMSMSAQIKGLSRQNQKEVYGDMLRLPVDPTTCTFAFNVDPTMKGTAHAAGFELIDTL